MRDDRAGFVQDTSGGEFDAEVEQISTEQVEVVEQLGEALEHGDVPSSSIFLECVVIPAHHKICTNRPVRCGSVYLFPQLRTWKRAVRSGVKCVRNIGPPAVTAAVTSRSRPDPSGPETCFVASDLQ